MFQIICGSVLYVEVCVNEVLIFGEKFVTKIAVSVNTDVLLPASACNNGGVKEIEFWLSTEK